jgi:hypothetical protein
MLEWKNSSTMTAALDGGEWSASRPGRFTSGEKVRGTHCIGGWVGPTAGMDMEKRNFLSLPGTEPRLSSPSLYRLSYPGSPAFFGIST